MWLLPPCRLVASRRWDDESIERLNSEKTRKTFGCDISGQFIVNCKEFPSMKLTTTAPENTVNLWPQVETNSSSSLSVSGATVCLFQVGDD